MQNALLYINDVRIFMVNVTRIKTFTQCVSNPFPSLYYPRLNHAFKTGPTVLKRVVRGRPGIEATRYQQVISLLKSCWAREHLARFRIARHEYE